MNSRYGSASGAGNHRSSRRVPTDVQIDARLAAKKEDINTFNEIMRARRQSEKSPKQKTENQNAAASVAVTTDQAATVGQQIVNSTSDPFHMSGRQFADTATVTHPVSTQSQGTPSTYTDGLSSHSTSQAALQRIVSVLTRLINQSTDSATSGEWRFEIALDADTTISLHVQKQGRRDWFVAFERDDKQSPGHGAADETDNLDNLAIALQQKLADFNVNLHVSVV